MGARLEALWGWPHSIWFVFWLFLFFAQFFLRIGTIWFATHLDTSSPSFSTLQESIAFSRAYDHLAYLEDPSDLANEAGNQGDFRLLGWANLRPAPRRGLGWCFDYGVWPVRCDEAFPFEDISFKIIEGATSLCQSKRLGAAPHQDDSAADYTSGNEALDHSLSGSPAFCRAADVLSDAAYVLEERGYDGSWPYTPIEAVAYYVRFISFMQTYNFALMAHPDAPKALKDELFLRRKYKASYYELKRDRFLPRLAQSQYDTWTDW